MYSKGGGGGGGGGEERATLPLLPSFFNRVVWSIPH